MNLAVVTLRFDVEAGAFDDAPLRASTAEHDVLGYHEHFFEVGGTPYWAVLLRWQARRSAGSAREATPPPRTDWAATVPAEDRGLYEALRSWRNERARQEGRPAYVLFTNRQIAAITQARPDTEATLREIDGIGEARARDYAGEVIAIVVATPRGAAVDVPVVVDGD
jgi:superfamily II DNA helicase RecQ